MSLGVCFAFEAELAAVVHAFEYARYFSWWRLWLKSHLAYLVALLCSLSHLGPLEVVPYLREVFGLACSDDFVVTHIQEG